MEAYFVRRFGETLPVGVFIGEGGGLDAAADSMRLIYRCLFLHVLYRIVSNRITFYCSFFCGRWGSTLYTANFITCICTWALTHKFEDFANINVRVNTLNQQNGHKNINMLNRGEKSKRNLLSSNIHSSQYPFSRPLPLSHE